MFLEPCNQFPKWKNGSSRLVSLLDMLQVYADEYVLMGQLLQKLIYQGRLQNAPDQPPSSEAFKEIASTIRNLKVECTKLHLIVSGGLVEDYIYKVNKELHKLPQNVPTWTEIGKEVDFLTQAINKELHSRLFMFIHPHRVSYFKGDDLLSEEGLINFSSAEYDMRQAGKCFAIECYTAAVNHLMKVAEYGLVAFAAFCEVPDKDRANWNTALNLIDKAIQSKSKGTIIPGNLVGMTKDDEQYYSEASAWLRSIKNAWRNPSSHIPTIYLEEQARDLFTLVKSLMAHLAKKFKQVPMAPLP